MELSETNLFERLLVFIVKPSASLLNLSIELIPKIKFEDPQVICFFLIILHFHAILKPFPAQKMTMPARNYPPFQ